MIAIRSGDELQENRLRMETDFTEENTSENIDNEPDEQTISVLTKDTEWVRNWNQKIKKKRRWAKEEITTRKPTNDIKKLRKPEKTLRLKTSEETTTTTTKHYDKHTSQIKRKKKKKNIL